MDLIIITIVLKIRDFINHMAQKIVGPAIDEYVDEYIPEFVNLKTAYTTDGVAYPDIKVTILS